jgi:hypothetical protein
LQTPPSLSFVLSFFLLSSVSILPYLPKTVCIISTIVLDPLLSSPNQPSLQLTNHIQLFIMKSTFVFTLVSTILRMAAANKIDKYQLCNEVCWTYHVNDHEECKTRCLARQASASLCCQ